MNGFYSAAALSLLLSVRAAAFEVPPAPTRQFDDRAGFVSADAAQRIESRLQAERERTGRELVVAVFPGLPEGVALEDFTVRTAQAWRVGRKGLDDGVVLFVFAADRRLRLEVGYGLEAVLPDATAKRILDEVITPHLRAGDHAAALEAGVEAVLTVAGGGALPDAPATPATPTFDLTSEDIHRFVAFPVLLAVVVFFLPKSKARSGQLPTSVVLSVVFGLLGTVFGMLLEPELMLRGAGFAAGAGLLLAAPRPGWRLWMAGGPRAKLKPLAARAITGVTALVGILHLATAANPNLSLGDWSLPALASLASLQSFALLGVWRAKLWSERILYLGLGGLMGFAYVQPAVSDGRFPSFLLVIPWAPIWSGAAALLHGLFSVLGLQPQKWWYDESGRQSGLAGGSWSSGGSSSSGSSSYSGGGGRFGGGGASGSW